MTTLRVLIVDDHIVFREGLRALLSRIDGMDVVDEAGTTKEAITKAAEADPDVILMDLNLPDGGGVEATAAILPSQPDTAVLVLTSHSGDKHLRDAVRAGARGYLLKDADPDSIIRAILAVHQGQVIFDPGMASQVLTATAAPEDLRAFPSLTDREYEVLDRLARGIRNDAIAARMGISLKTVQNNISAILLKLNAVDKAQAVAIARDAGLGTPDPTEGSTPPGRQGVQSGSAITPADDPACPSASRPLDELVNERAEGKVQAVTQSPAVPARARGTAVDSPSAT